MADLLGTFFTERKMSDVPGGGAPLSVPLGSSAQSEAVDIGIASAQSSKAAGGVERFLKLRAFANCWVAIGSNPTAVALASGGTSEGTSFYLATGETLDVEVRDGDKFAVIQA